VTLTEVIVASALAVVVAMGIMMTDVSRFQMEQEIRTMAGPTVSGQQDPHQAAATVVMHLTKHLMRADRFVLINTGIPGERPSGAVNSADIQLRIPECPASPPSPSCFDAATTYRWHQYRLVGDELRFYLDTHNTVLPCSNVKVLSRQISEFTIAYLDTAPPPPGEDPFPTPPSPNLADNNIVAFRLKWDDGGSPAQTHEFRGSAVFRSTPYSDVNADCAGSGIAGGPCDSGTGLSPAGISNPPSSC
jgi:hypothetical protein